MTAAENIEKTYLEREVQKLRGKILFAQCFDDSLVVIVVVHAHSDCVHAQFRVPSAYAFLRKANLARLISTDAKRPRETQPLPPAIRKRVGHDKVSGLAFVADAGGAPEHGACHGISPPQCLKVYAQRKCR